jgi:serine phosphatase RsbU (regulator of sigma subunit)
LLDYHQGQLCLSGQHEEVIVVRTDGSLERIDTIDLGFPIGLEEDIADFISHTQVQLYPRDVVVLYTDGITEAENLAGEQYGIERLCEVVRGNRQQSAEQIKQTVLDDLRSHIGQQKVYDDITLLILKQK